VATIAEVVSQVVPPVGDAWQLLLIDDGSTDGTWHTISELSTQHPFVSGVRLGMNAGQQAALLCGYQHALGDWMLTLDADLQDPPEVLLEMWKGRSDSAQILIGRRTDRSVDGPIKRLTASGFYALMQLLGMPRAAMHAGEFRLISRQVAQALISAARPPLFHRLTILELGFPVAFVEYTRGNHLAGATKFTFTRMLRLACQAIWSSPTTRRRMAVICLIGCGLMGGILTVNSMISWMPLSGMLPLLTIMNMVLAGYGISSLVWLLKRQDFAAPFQVIATCGK
jgi:dolichol-phosphate mannosyltransferase